MKGIIKLIWTIIFFAPIQLLAQGVNTVGSHISIRGPLVIYSLPVQYHYHLQTYNASVGSTSTWSVYPSTSGTIISGTLTEVQVQWNNFNGMLIFNNGVDCIDTLFMQASCPLPSDIHFDIKVHDLTDVDWDTPSSIISQTLALNLGSISGSSIVVRNKTIFIEGVLNLEQTGITFDSCNIYFGSGATINAPSGPPLIFNHCTLSGVCAMWQGIRPWTHSIVKLINGTKLSDAEYGLSISCDEFTLVAIDAEFTRNFVSIYSPINPTSRNSFSWYSSAINSSIIQKCIFDGQELIQLPPYNGQHGIPVGKKTFAGMMFNGLDLSHPAPPVYSTDTLSIPFSLNPDCQTVFKNLNFGIFAVNSKIDVYNCRFRNIQPALDPSNQVCYAGTNLCNGSAIYSIVTLGNQTKSLNIGGAGSNSVAKHNEFIDCNYGVYSLYQVDSRIDSNRFVHGASIGGFVIPSGVGINLKNPDLRKVLITRNEFRDYEIQTNNSPLRSVGIYISSGTMTRKSLKILNNVFTDTRLAIYVQNSKGSNYRSYDFQISENSIYSTIPPLSLNSSNDLHFGIWLNYVQNASIYNNTIARTYSLAQEPPNFESKMYGVNINSSSNVSISSNNIMEYGTAFRVVSNCSGSTFKCNYMVSCVKGIMFAKARILDQGNFLNAWDNHWDGFPHPAAGYYNRIDGKVVVPVNWYNSGNANTASNYNRFSPEPLNTAFFNSIPNTPSDGCASPVVEPLHSDITNAIEDIVNNDVGYSIFPSENRELDKEYAYFTLMDDTMLRDSISIFGDFIVDESSSNYASLWKAQLDRERGHLSDALAQLDLVYDPTTIEYNQKWTQSISTGQEINGSEELSPELVAPLQELAWTNVWIGGPGVINARHLLNAEVFDIDRNLRLGIPDTQKMNIEPVAFSFYPNPTENEITLFYNTDLVDNLHVIITNTTGSVVLDQNIKTNHIDLNMLSRGVYSLQLYFGNTLQSVSKLVIVK